MYMGLAAGFSVIDPLFRETVLKPIAESTPESVLGLYLIGFRIALVALFAAVDSVLLARIGREVDKPYWRVPSDREALARFYRLWLLLGLMGLVYEQLSEQVAAASGSESVLFFFRISYYIFIVLLHVFGTAVMFYGKVGREEVSQAFTTMSNHARFVVGMCLLQILVGIGLDGVSDLVLLWGPPFAAGLALTAALGLVLGYLSCLIFTFMWLVCIYDRDEYERDREDFDL
jgi:hypothetical protein